MPISGSKHSCIYCAGTIIVGEGPFSGITWHESPVCAKFTQLVKDGKDLAHVIKKTEAKVIRVLKMEKKRITFRGKPAVRGTCQCGKTLIIEDPNPALGGKFRSYHQKPMCAAYIDIVKDTHNEGEGAIDESEYE